MTNVIDFHEASQKLRNNQYKQEETYSLDEMIEYNFSEEYSNLMEQMLWFFFLLTDYDDYETWVPSIEIKMLMTIFDGVLFSLLGELKEPPSIFVQDIIEKMGIQEIEEINM